jgi:hypothetical protein
MKNLPLIIVTEFQVFFPKGYEFPVPDVTELKINMSKVYEWIEATNSNELLCSEGEIIDLEPKEFIYSDLFINSTEKQHQLINYVIKDLEWKR